MNQAKVWQWIKEWRLLLIPFAGASSAVVTYVRVPLAFGQKFATATQRKNAEATPC